MKIRLLSDGGFLGMGDMKIPAIVEGSDLAGLGLGFDVLGSELIRVGGNKNSFDEEDTYYFSLLRGECEVIEE